MHTIQILAISFTARKVEIHSVLMTDVREILARIAALLNVAILDTKPRHLMVTNVLNK